MAAPTSQEKRKPDSSRDALTPPDEKFWQRYSPHHEFPLSGVGSMVVHGLLLGLLVLIGFGWSRSPLDDPRRPPGMDVVGIEGGGDIFEGFGGSPGLPGLAKKGERTEFIPGQTETPSTPEKKSISPQLLDPGKVDTLVVPPPVGAAETEVDLTAYLADVKRQAAEDAFQKAVTTGKVDSVGKDKVGKPGTKGTGTGGIKGDGTGSIKGQRKATEKEVLAFRWRFDLAGQGKDHADKLDKAGVVVAVLHPNGQYLVIRDVKRRPAEPRMENLAQFQNVVKWYNTDPSSIYQLARELQLPFTPNQVVMLLPRDREAKMAAEEQRLAQERGIQSSNIRVTWFDFRLRNGAFEPVAIRIE